MKQAMHMVLAAAAALAASGLHAVDAVWTNKTTSVANWQTASNWQDGAVPGADGDTATFPYIDRTMRTVNLLNVKDVNPSIDAIYGGAKWKLRLNAKGDGTYGDYTMSFSVKDVNGYAGEWAANGSKKTLKLTADSGAQNLFAVNTSQQFCIAVTNAAVTADVAHVCGTAGSVKKSGPGTLRIREVHDSPDLILEVAEGTVTLDGRASDAAASIASALAKASVHLDASATNTFTTYVDDADRVRITKWADASGGDNYAEVWDNSHDTTTSHVKDIKPPFVSPAKSPSGLPLVDFGANKAANVDTYGPQCIMRLHSRIDSAQEVFWVAMPNDGYQVLGDVTDYSFSGNNSYLFTYGESFTNNGGFVHLNGGFRTPDLEKSGDYWRIKRLYDSYTPGLQSLQLVNIRLGDGNTKPVKYLASDRLYATAGSASGGVRFGELIVFEQALTDGERAAVNDYLMHKWFGGNDFQLADVANGTAIEVPEGRIASIGTLRATGSTFVKKGAGTLEVSRIYPENLTITVEGGDVKISPTVVDVSTNAPAGTPQFWFDADAADCFTTNEAGLVTAWKDCRGNGGQATRANYTQITTYPSIDETTLPGHKVLDFPTASAYTYTGGQRETFVVFQYKTANAAKQNNVVSDGYETDRWKSSTSALFAHPNVAPDEMGGGYYTVNGIPVRPFETTGSTFEAEKWYVASLATTAAYGLNLIASSGSRNPCGDVRIGEIVTYTTALSSAERRDTVAYLMAKWLGRKHPEAAAPSKAPTLSFAPDAAAVLVDDVGTEVASVTGGNGSLVKRGEGATTVEADLADTFTSLSVEGGTLTITKPSEPTDNSIYHFDVSDASTFQEFFVDANGETNVQKIADVRGNGTYAYKSAPWSPSAGNMFYVTNPIVRFAEFAPGVTRPYLDFLQYTGRNVNPPTGAGLHISPAPKSTAMKEFHAVVATHTACDLITGSSNVDFKRGLKNYGQTAAKIFRLANETAACSSDVLDGYIAIDGDETTAAKYLENDKFYLLSVAPLSGKDASTLSIETSIYSGGRCYGEVMAFPDYLSEKERAYLQEKLLYKWFGKGSAPVWTSEAESISVARGATLAVQGGAISAQALSGGGTIAASVVSGIATIDVAYDAGLKTTVPLTIEGSAKFADDVTVNIAGALVRPPSGLHVILEADDLGDADPSGWTLNATLSGTSSSCRLVRSGQAICLQVIPAGALIIVR